MLILRYLNEGNESVNERVWYSTMNFLAKSLEASVVHEFKNNLELVNEIEGSGTKVVLSTGKIAKDTCLLLRGMGVVLILVGVNKEVMDLADVVVDPLERPDERFFYGSDFLLPAVLDETSLPEVADGMRLDHDSLKDQVKHNSAEERLLDIIKLFAKLEWDSDFFGFNVGYISCMKLTPNIEKQVGDFVREKDIDLLEYRCNCHDQLSVETAEKNGYSFVDIRLTLEQYIQKPRVLDEMEGFFVRKAVESDIEVLQECGRDIYRLSRYYFDKHFDQEKVNEFYEGWIRKGVLGQFDDYCYVLCDGDVPIGFCTIKEFPVQSASIGLVGLSQSYGGLGLGVFFLSHVLNALSADGVQYVEVVTQGRNYAAQRLYQRCGFLTKQTELWYHKWFR